MHLAIIGATSFLAKALFKKWSASPSTPIFRCYSRQPIVLEQPHQWVLYDYPTSPLDVEALLDCAVIYFCAGAGIQPKHSDNAQQIYGLNAFAPIQLATALEAANYQGKLVTFGSYFEIGDQQAQKEQYSTVALASHRNPLPNAYCRAKNLLTRFADSKLLPDTLALPYC